MVELIPIPRDGTPPVSPAPDVLTQVCRATADLYASRGFVEPWISYVAVDNGAPVGICAFKSAPSGGRVEIAYYTFQDHEGRGMATAMAAQLMAIAARHDPAIVLTAKTLPQRNASHRVLEKLGFDPVGTLEHPVEGLILEWENRSG